MNTLLVTGAAGFIGSNFVRQVLARDAGVRIVALDKLTYAGNLQNLADLLRSDRLSFVKADICDLAALNDVFDASPITQIVHFAAESHV